MLPMDNVASKCNRGDNILKCHFILLLQSATNEATFQNVALQCCFKVRPTRRQFQMLLCNVASSATNEMTFSNVALHVALKCDQRDNILYHEATFLARIKVAKAIPSGAKVSERHLLNLKIGTRANLFEI